MFVDIGHRTADGGQRLMTPYVLRPSSRMAADRGGTVIVSASIVAVPHRRSLPEFSMVAGESLSLMMVMIDSVPSVRR